MGKAMRYALLLDSGALVGLWGALNPDPRQSAKQWNEEHRLGAARRAAGEFTVFPRRCVALVRIKEKKHAPSR
jgi:hypothetical protein